MSDEKNLLRLMLGGFFVIELAILTWVMGFDLKAGITMSIYGFICACRGSITDRYRRAQNSTSPPERPAKP